MKLMQTYFDISSTFELYKPYLHLLEPSSGASILKKQGNLHRCLKTADIKLMQTFFDISITFEPYKQVYSLNASRISSLVRGHPF